MVKLGDNSQIIATKAFGVLEYFSGKKVVDFDWQHLDAWQENGVTHELEGK